MVASLQREGHDIEPISPPCFNDIFETYVVIATSAHATRLSLLAEKWGDKMTASMRKSIERGARYSAVELQRAQDSRTVLFRSVQRLFDRYDLLLTPTMTAPPAKIDADGSVESDMYAEHAAPLYPFNLTGHPAASVPAGFTKSGLPVGLQIIGPWFAENRILKVAAELESIHFWNQRWPKMVRPSGSSDC
jgi:aspartyl-tRNA(Asn)/glutamyl-tRNA(Gln) amidotransferase subunit A